MLPLATEATTEEETNTDTICSQQITQANWIHASRHITDDREGQENLEWEAVIGSVSSATIQVNFDSLKLTQLLSCSDQLVLSF